MIATITDNQWIYIRHITDPEEDILWVEFSVSREDRYVDPSQRGNWDGVYRKYNRGQRRLARPLLSMLRGICAKHNLPLVLKDEREPWKYEPVPIDQINSDFLPGITLEQYQIDCIRKGTQPECGIIEVPTGGGKGELIAGFCKAIPCPTLILADQVVVIKQLKERLELRDIAEEVGIFYAGKRPNGQAIVVGSIQSLTPPTKPPDIPKRLPTDTQASYDKKSILWDKKYRAFTTRRKNAKILLGYAKRAEMLIVDECDLATSEPWKSLFRHHFRGRRRYGFSGTPFDKSKPVEGLVMQEHLGSVIFRESKATLIGLGRIVQCEYRMLAYGLDGDPGEGSAYDIAYNEHITDSVDFHTIVAQVCKKEKKRPEDGTLVLVDREPLGHNLVKAITAVGLRAEFIYGKTSQKKRDQVLQQFQKREIDVLVGGKIINRGLDLKGGCEHLVIATGGKLASGFKQKVGRAFRNNSRGKSKITDFLFRCNKYLYGHSKDRLKTMVGEMPTHIVFPGGVVTGEDFIKSRFRIKKELLISVRKQPSLLNVAANIVSA